MKDKIQRSDSKRYRQKRGLTFHHPMFIAEDSSGKYSVPLRREEAEYIKKLHRFGR